MRVGVMASGRGSNFQALIDAAESGETPDVELVHLIVNKKGAYAIQRAKKHGIEHTLITSDDKTRREFDQDVLGLLKKQNNPPPLAFAELDVKEQFVIAAVLYCNSIPPALTSVEFSSNVQFVILGLL